MTARKPIPHDGGPCPVPDMTPIRPVYRGPVNEPYGMIRIAPAVRIDWTHDGGGGDVVAYYIEDVP